LNIAVTIRFAVDVVKNIDMNKKKEHIKLEEPKWKDTEYNGQTDWDGVVLNDIHYNLIEIGKILYYIAKRME